MSEQEVKATTLVGWVRIANKGGSIKISINKEAFEECSSYNTSDGQQYVPLNISLQSLKRVINGDRAVTTILQIETEELWEAEK